MQPNNRLLICGAGNQDDEIIRTISSSDLIIARDDIAFRWLKTIQIGNAVRFSKKENQTLSDWTKEVIENLPSGTKITYVTSFKPVFADQAALALAKTIGIEHLQVASGRDYTAELIQYLLTCPSSTVVTVDGLELTGKHHPPFSADDTVVVYSPGQTQRCVDLQALLVKSFSTQHLIQAYYEDPDGDAIWHQLPLEELNKVDQIISILMIPPASRDSSLESFQEIIAHLRAPEDGCPWDKKQTHSSLRTYLLEETYEALDALDKNDAQGLKEELGDILLQILLHAQIASESSEFTMSDVISGINRKIVYRHPHVFKDWVVNDENDVVQNWESLKGQERKKNGKEDRKGMLDGVPVSFPALAQAQAIQDRAARVGFDWPEITPVIDKIFEEIDEVKTAPDEHERAKELGDLLFAIVNLIRWYKVDAESVLRQTNLKFRKRFAYIEDQARLAGRELQQMSLSEMDEFWEQAKEFDD